MCKIQVPNYGENQEESIQKEQIRNATDLEKQLFRDIFQEYVLQQNQEYSNIASFVHSQFLSGISDTAITEILEHLPFITGMDYILQYTAIYKQHHAGEIVLMINDIFSDMIDTEILL